MVRRCVRSTNLVNEEALAQWGLSRQKQTNKQKKKELLEHLAEYHEELSEQSTALSCPILQSVLSLLSPSPITQSQHNGNQLESHLVSS